MKNIHVLPSNKPSAIGYHFDTVKTGSLDFAPNFGFEKFDVKNNFQHRPHNIYITNDEEIKEEDWGLSKLNEVILFGRSYNEKFYKKIILTTDQDLIQNGVQEIPYEFLEWFVKNPNCEDVEVDEKTNKEIQIEIGTWGA